MFVTKLFAPDSDKKLLPFGDRILSSCFYWSFTHAIGLSYILHFIILIIHNFS